MKFSKFLYGLALLGMPLTYAVRNLFGLVGITWIDPTLILGLVIFLLLGMPMKEKTPFWLVAFAFLSAFIGMFILVPSADRDKSSLYVYYVEPIRLGLNIIWFWVSIRFLILDRKFVIRWLAICATAEFSIACYLYLALYDLAPVPDIVKLYLEIYKTRQVVFWGELPIYRMAGTFDESPLFGLFMFCCFVIFVLTISSSAASDDRQFNIWLRVGALCAFFGTVASLSDQILIALLMLGIVFVLVRSRGNRVVLTLFWSSPILILALYSASALATRWKSDSYYTGDPMGTSISERSFHARYGLGLFLEQPASVITGIGPGRYGDYAVRTGYFPSTVTTQFTIIDWAVEYGFVGLLLIGLWLFRIGSHAVLSYGIIGGGALMALLIANMFQANWLWEAWFLALAFLCAGARRPTLEPAQ